MAICKCCLSAGPQAPTEPGLTKKGNSVRRERYIQQKTARTIQLTQTFQVCYMLCPIEERRRCHSQALSTIAKSRPNNEASTVDIDIWVEGEKGPSSLTPGTDLAMREGKGANNMNITYSPDARLSSRFSPSFQLSKRFIVWFLMP